MRSAKKSIKIKTILLTLLCFTQYTAVLDLANAAEPPEQPSTQDMAQPANALVAGQVTAPVTDPAEAQPAVEKAPPTTLDAKLVKPPTDMAAPVSQLTSPDTSTQVAGDAAKTDTPPVETKPAAKLPIKAYASVIAQDYILGPNDILSLQVFGFPDLTHDQLKVQPDGQLMLDLIGPIQVAGMTTTQLYDLVVEKYSKLLKNPRITLNVVQTKPIIFYITGAVINPGIYEVLTSTINMTRFNNQEINIDRRTPILSSMLSACGGITYDADFEHIEINNKFTGEKRVVNLLSLIQDGIVDEDVYLHPGDSIRVPRISPLAQDPKKYRVLASASFTPRTVPVKVYGFVNQQGLIELNPAQNLNMMAAIAAAGGFYREAAYAPTKVYIFRPDNNGKLAHIGTFNPTQDDPQLMPNDIVYVPDKLRPNIAKVFDYVNNVIRPFASAAVTYRNASGKFLINDNQR
jgi:polysaccharide biosynthesis/export protein